MDPMGHEIDSERFKKLRLNVSYSLSNLDKQSWTSNRLLSVEKLRYSYRENFPHRLRC